MPAPAFKVGDFVRYHTPIGCPIDAIVRRVNVDGTFTIEARHFINTAGERSGPYLGYRYRMEAAELALREPSPTAVAATDLARKATAAKRRASQ